MVDRPSPPDVPQYLLDGLEQQNPATLRTIAKYARQLAEWQESGEKQEPDDTGAASADDRETQSDLPEDVPAKASIVIKEINGNRYYYWQWRDGDSVKSKYKGPVASEE